MDEGLANPGEVVQEGQAAVVNTSTSCLGAYQAARPGTMLCIYLEKLAMAHKHLSYLLFFSPRIKLDFIFLKGFFFPPLFDPILH